MCCKCLMQCYSSSNDSHLIFVRLPHHLQDRKRIVRTTFVNQTFQTVQPQESPFAHWISKHYTKMTKFSMDAIFSLPCCSLYLNIETINDLIKSVLVFIFLIFLTLALPSSNFSPALYMTALSGRLVRMKQIPWKQEMALTVKEQQINFSCQNNNECIYRRPTSGNNNTPLYWLQVPRLSQQTLHH